MKSNKILAISINDYNSTELNKLQNCYTDVSKIVEVLVEKYSFDDVEFIHKKEDTTRSSLFNYLKEYFVNCLEEENVILIYAGHGEYNSDLETAYWQPSDADPIDSSGWLSLTEIMAFIKASKAFHISVISDSCFSGAMFEKSRGGGIDAFESKKSRMALTSGGLEKVSDGVENDSSPFAKSLITLLNNNTLQELPFSLLGQNLLLDFEEERVQTPIVGPLGNVGHEGGSFVFRLKNETTEIENENEFLKEKMSALYIPVSEEHLRFIKDLKLIREEKSIVVKRQKYEKAVELRDKEKQIESDIFDSCNVYIDAFFSSIVFNEESKEKSDKLDQEIEEFEKNKINPEDFSSSLFGVQQFLTDYFKSPAVSLFANNKSIFYKCFKDNILKIYEEMLILKSSSKSEYLKIKTNDLFDFLIKIYKYEVRLLVKGYRDSIDEFFDLKELEMDIVNWIRIE